MNRTCMAHVERCNFDGMFFVEQGRLLLNPFRRRNHGCCPNLAAINAPCLCRQQLFVVSGARPQGTKSYTIRDYRRE